MLVLHALILLRDENYLSHSQLVIRKAPNIFKAKNIFGKAKTSIPYKSGRYKNWKIIFILYFIPNVIPEV